MNNKLKYNILRDYQRSIAQKAAQSLIRYRIAYLSMEVRTGKTLTALVAADIVGCSNVLFLTKKKAISSPEADYEKLKPGFKLTVINYEQLHNLDDIYDLIICDEAHCLGQYPKPAGRVTLLKELAEGLPIIYLSGTPTPESYSQIYHQFFISSFSPFLKWKTFYKWAVDFVTLKKKYIYNRQINDYSCANKALIDQLTSHLFFNFSQQDAGFKSDIIEELIEIKMKPGTYALAERLRKKKIYIGKGGQEILADTAVKLMNKFHQVFSGSVLAEDGTATVFDCSKAQYICDNFTGQKIAIFYKFKAELTMLQTVFGEGWLTSDPDEFRDSDRKVFCSQIQSGREGINLSTADCLIMLNIDYSSLSYWQARARLQEMNREKPYKVYWLFSKGGIERKIYETVLQKKDYTLSYFKKQFKP